MTYAAQAVTSGRKPITIVELDLDYCQLTYGQPPCMAAIGITGSSPCYNTRATCQDPANYFPFTADSPDRRAYKTYRFCTARSDIPGNLEAIPSVQDVALAPTKIEIGGGFGQRASVTIAIQDHSYHDRGIDKYWTTRYGGPFSLAANAAGDPLQANAAGDELQARAGGSTVLPSGENLAGTYWGRLRARNPYYLGRVCRVMTGYLTDAGGYEAANFTTRTYLLESMTGPDSSGRVTIKAKDPLVLAGPSRVSGSENDGAQAPVASNGSLVGAIDENDTAATLTPDGIGDEEYPAEGYLRIGKEVVSFTRAGDVLTIIRAQFGTPPEVHDAGDTAQLCLRYAAQSIPDIQYDLLLNYAHLPVAYLDKAAWDAEADLYLPRTYSTLITQPTGVAALVKELTQLGYSTWWDERDSLVKIRALRGPDPTAIIDEDSNILAGTLAITDKPDMRVSDGWVSMSQIDATDSLTDQRNYRTTAIYSDLEASGANKFGSMAIKKVLSRWIPSRITADELAEQQVVQFGETPRQVSFQLDAKDATNYWTGSVLYLNTRLVQDFNGNNSPLNVLIIEASEVEAGQTFKYVGQAFNFTAPPLVGEQIIISASDNDVNLLDLYTVRTGFAPTATTIVTFITEPGVIIGQSGAPAAMRTDIWPSGSMIGLENNGRVQGKGARGSQQGDPGIAPESGDDGGTALLAEYPIRVFNFGDIWSGGGGGGGIDFGGGVFVAGGGGAGTIPGFGGSSYSGPTQDGEDGTGVTGGAGGTYLAIEGGTGGGPGLPGQAGTGGGTDINPGMAGFYVVNNSNVTWAVTGDRRGRVG